MTQEKKILVIGSLDNVTFVRGLELPNTTIISTDSVEEGLKMALKERPDLVVEDVYCSAQGDEFAPVPSGFGFLEQAKAPESLIKDIPVIIRTAGSVEDRIHAMELGADTFFTSSVDDDVAVVEKIIKEKLNRKP